MRRLMKIAPIDERSSLTRGRRGSTAVMMDYPMWLMSASEFLRLSELRPHEELRAEGSSEWLPRCFEPKRNTERKLGGWIRTRDLQPVNAH